MGPFPKHFVWGAASSAYQIEGAARVDGRGPCIWDDHFGGPGIPLEGVTGEVACDHYHRLEEDIELMKRLGLKAYRFSVSWSRVFPEGRGPINQAGLGFYDRLVDGLKDAGIEPFITAYHWDLPSALQRELGGWAHPDLPRIFADYASVLFDRLGDRVAFWLTINEPWCIVDGGYFQGIHAPGIKDRRIGYRVGHNLMRAHAYAVERYRASINGTGQISLAINGGNSCPASNEVADVEAAERAMQNFAGWFADPAYYGDYPAVMRQRLGDLLPEFSAEDRSLLTRSMDYLALNYYTSDVIRGAPGNGAMELEVVPQPEREHTEMGWPIVPQGLRRFLGWMAKRYPMLPVYVTENGAAMADVPDQAGYVDDQDRIAYLRDHLASASEAVSDGVDLRGYFAWSLMDNLEWSLGFSKRFGLIRCDFDTLKRTIKASGHWYANVIRAGGLEPKKLESGVRR